MDFWFTLRWRLSNSESISVLIKSIWIIAIITKLKKQNEAVWQILILNFVMHAHYVLSFYLSSAFFPRSAWKEGVWCVLVVLTLTEKLEQGICIKFNQKLGDIMSAAYNFFQKSFMFLDAIKVLYNWKLSVILVNGKQFWHNLGKNWVEMNLY